MKNCAPLQTGDPEAFREIYKKYWDKLLYIAGKKLAVSEVESIVQDVFVDSGNAKRWKYGSSWQDILLW